MRDGVAAASCADNFVWWRSGLVDGSGSLANVGLLQVRTELGFGTVCGLNAGAAAVVCRLMGYDHGVVGSSSCGSYGGSHRRGVTQCSCTLLCASWKVVQISAVPLAHPLR